MFKGVVDHTKDDEYIDQLVSEIQDKNKQIIELEVRNVRYREALGFYADVDNYYDKLRVVYSELEQKDVYVNDGNAMDGDNKGDKAREALKGDQNDG